MTSQLVEAARLGVSMPERRAEIVSRHVDMAAVTNWSSLVTKCVSTPPGM